MHKNLRTLGVMVKHLDDEYEEKQLNPVWTKNPKSGDPTASSDDLRKEVNKLKEATAMRLRIATMEAIVDQIVEDKIEEDPGATTEEITEEVEPMLDKAVELALVPPQIKSLINPAIIRHRKKRDPRMVLMEKCATFMTQTMTRMEESKAEDNEIKEQINDDMQKSIQEDLKESLSPETEHPAYQDEKKAYEEGIDGISQDELDTESPLPKPAAESMKMLVASTINTKRAKARVIRNIAGAVSEHMFHELRYCLPAKFKAKYGIR